MTLETLAMKVVEAVESAGVEFMVGGAMAAGAYGVPRSTRDVDLLVSVNVEGGLAVVMGRLDSIVTFDAQYGLHREMVRRAWNQESARSCLGRDSTNVI
jgi:hypothetical protein